MAKILLEGGDVVTYFPPTDEETSGRRERFPVRLKQYNNDGTWLATTGAGHELTVAFKDIKLIDMTLAGATLHPVEQFKLAY